jgi:hypothetical protein
LLAAACESHDLVCERVTYFVIPKPHDVYGRSPFIIDQPGPQVKSSDLEEVPDALRLTSRNRVIVDWRSHGRVVRHTNLLFSPDDKRAGSEHLDASEEEAHPMMRFPEDARERVRFGFRARKCADPESCAATNDRLFLMAEMLCHRE